jgi:beta-N-acetylhexosaminidase
MIVARFVGSSPSTSFLDRVKAGEIGGVILFADNVAGGEAATRGVIAQLQRAAADGSNPPLLIMLDQEGGEVKRLLWAPPALAPSQMSSSAVARSEGEATGRALRSAGVNVDLAPVVDVKHLVGSFLGDRSFGSTPESVALRACSFAEGIASASVAFTLKHFPGLGWARSSTDVQATTVEESASALRNDFEPYRVCGGGQTTLVMVSSASYPTLTGTSQPAVLSPEIYRQELPSATGGNTPVTISDDLQTPAIAPQPAPAQQAINAGLDLLLYAQTEEGSASAYQRLLTVAQSGGVARARLEQANQAIQALKEVVAGAAPEASASGPAASAGEPGTAAPRTIGEPTTLKPEPHSEK